MKSNHKGMRGYARDSITWIKTLTVASVFVLAAAGMALASEVRPAPAERQNVHPAPPLDPAVIDAMVAALPKHSVPLTASTADGFTLTGVNRTTKSGAVTFFEEIPFVSPVPTPGITLHIISWDIVQQESSFNCDFTTPLTTTTETLQNHYTIDYSIDASGTPGEIDAINVVIPSFRNNEPGATIAWPIDQLSVAVTVTTSAGTQSGTAVVAAPPPGADANYLVQLVSPLDVGDGNVQIAVDLDGEVQPPLANPTTINDPACPGLGIFGADGRSQLLLDNTFVTIFIEEAATSAIEIEITPTSSTIDLTQTQSFSAFDCPEDANGNPDVGPDGVPGTSDDLCTPATNANWTVTGNIGNVDQATGPTTTLTPSLPADSASETGQVIVDDGTTTAAADVTVNLSSLLTAGVTALDHFKCYKAQGDAVEVLVDLEDQFATESQVQVGRPKRLCIPVDKNGEGISDPTAWLACYRLKGEGENREVVIENQFGAQTWEIEEPKYLCVPSSENPDGIADETQ